jgi:predicted nucleic acid-binding protein
VNASPLIVLAKISQIHPLSELCSDIVVPNGVVAEINVAPDDDRAKLWM